MYVYGNFQHAAGDHHDRVRGRSWRIARIAVSIVVMPKSSEPATTCCVTAALFPV